jgi:hypothetical protein
VQGPDGEEEGNHGQPPELTKNQAVHKWVDSFVLHLSQKVGVCNAPLDYIVRAIAAMNPVPPAHQVDDPHSIETGLIDGDLIARMPHNHPLFKVDNGMTFNMIKTSFCGHDVAATITPFCHAQDGHGALLALQSQHAGKAIYDQLINNAENFLKNRTWSGTTLVTLSQHMGLHCKVYITLTECAEHIPVEIPNDWTQVTYLLDSFKTIDPSFLAAMAAVHQDDADRRINKNASLSWHPLALFLLRPQRRGGFLLTPMSLVLGLNLIRVVWVEIALSLGKVQLESPSVTKSLKDSRTCPRNSNRN